MDLVFFGIQGSGKGTQAKKLAAERNYYIFEAGAELRSIAATDTELGNTVKSYIDEGHLVPHEIIMKVVKAAILAQPKHQKILFDGIPRDEDQMNDFNAIMKEVGRDFYCINILLDKEEAMERIRQRAEEQGRVDDADEEKVKRRISLFEEKTMPVIRTYTDNDQMVQISGSGTIDEVYALLCEVVR